MSPVVTKRIDWNAAKERLRIAQTAIEHSSEVDHVRIRQVFHERAARLAAHPTNLGSTTNSVAVLVVTSGEESYGIELQYVAQVLPEPRVTPVPGASEPLLGVANLRGDVRSVLDLRLMLGLPNCGNIASRYVLLLRQEGRQVGLRVGQIEGVRRILPNALIPADNFADPAGRYIQGVTPDNLAVLRTDAIFDHLSPGQFEPMPDEFNKHCRGAN